MNKCECANTANGPTIADLLYRPNASGGHPDPVGAPGKSGVDGLKSYSYDCYPNPNRRVEVGWICPVCGRGLAPSASYCPCNLTNNITYINSDSSSRDIAIDCKVTSLEVPYTETATNATTATKKCNGGIYGAHCDARK